MQRFLSYIILFFLLSGLSACLHFAEPVLDHNAQLAEYQEAEKGVNALLMNKGVIDQFSDEIYSWWGANGITLSRKQDTFKVVINNVGSAYVPFGREITSIDFTTSHLLRVRMRCEGKSSPVVRLDLKDNMGRTTNAMAVQNRVTANKSYQDFYYYFRDKYVQAWPDKQIVDSTLISSVMFFVNPGMTDWTGVLYIDEIEALPLDSLPKKESKSSLVVDDFSDEPSAWWVGSSKIALEKEADIDILKITSDGAGANYETFGRAFERVDCNKSPIIRIRARAEKKAGDKNPKIRIALKDNNGYTSNEFDIVQEIDSSMNYKNYFFDCRGKFSQTYPDQHSVNANAIEGLVIFINSGGPAFYGKIYIEEIEVIDEKKMNELLKQ